MNVVKQVIALVANLEKERDYYKEATRELQDVVKQITEGPGEVELIHPLDFAEVMEDADVVAFESTGRIVVVRRRTATDKKYKQSIYVPRNAKFKKYV